MKFNSHTTVEGKHVHGKIVNGIFELTSLVKGARVSPILNQTRYYDDEQLTELIGELQVIRNKIQTK